MFLGRTPADGIMTRTSDASAGSSATAVAAASAARHWPAALDRWAYATLLGAIVWAPWPLGSNRPWAVALLAFVLWLAVALAVSAAALAGPKSSLAQSRPWPAAAYLPLAALASFALLLVAQMLPGLGPGGGPISIDPFHTRAYLLRTLLYAGAWLLVLLTVRDRERAGRLLGAVVAAGVLQAVGAVVLYSSGAHYDWLFTPFDQGGRAQGTFPSPDHLAGYMELCLSAGLGWLIAQLGAGEGQGRGWRSQAVGFLSFVMSAKMLLRLLLVVMVIALVMTHSRMGNGAFFLAIGIVGALVAARSRQLRRPALWLVGSMALVDVLVIGQWVGLDRVIQRLEHTAEASSEALAGFGLGAAPPPPDESLALRLTVPRLSMQLVVQRPLFGWGGGTYATAFPPFKQPGLPWHWDHAHDDYVQVACDTGLVGLALWLAVGVASLARALRLLNDGQSRMNRGVAVAALMALCCIGLHSVVDFNLHIPSNALVFTVLLALVWAVPAETGRRRRPPHRLSRHGGTGDEEES